jgi:hypothetical protein
LEALLPDAVVEGMNEEVRALYEELGALDGGMALLHFLHSNSHSVLTADDIAYFVGQPQVDVERNIQALLEMGWARAVHLLDSRWYGLTEDRVRRRIVRELFAWQDNWHARLEQIRRAIDGGALIEA